MITYYHRNVEEDCLVLFFCSASISTLFERQRSWTVSWSFSLRLSYSDWMQQVFRTSGDIFELLPVLNCFRFCIFRLCLFACVHALYLKLCSCVFVFSRLHSKPWNSSSAVALSQPGSWVRGQVGNFNWTSGRGGGSTFTRYPDCPWHWLLFIVRGLLHGMHPVHSSVWTWDKKKTEDSDLNWPLPLTTHLVLMAQGQMFN